MSLWSLSLALVGSLTAAPSAHSSEGKSDLAPHVAHQLLVRFAEDASAGEIARVHSALGASVLQRYSIVSGLQLVRIPRSLTVERALSRYRASPRVLYAEPDFTLKALAAPNDPRFGEQWALHNTGQQAGTPDADIDAPEAWDITTGSAGVVVATIDTGIDYNHADLAASVFRNEVECDADGVDDDGNGYVDDCHGINTIDGTGDPMDDESHGTHVAGIIGAVGDNGIGVTGVNWTTRLLACKFLSAAGVGLTSDAVECLQYVKAMKGRGVPIVATNNSWGSATSGCPSLTQAARDAIRAHLESGILFVKAAGNDSYDQDGCADGTSDLPNVVSVAATTRTDSLAGFSNRGQRTVHLGAPGDEILSTVPGNAYAEKSGTSMAAPHVAGVAALLKAADPSRSWRAIRNLLLAGGDSIPSLAATTITGRRLNAHGALTCSGSKVFALQSPRAIVLRNPQSVGVRTLQINCADDVTAPFEARVIPGNETLLFHDDGVAPDTEEGDGQYSAAWSPNPGEYKLQFPGSEEMSVTVLSPYVERRYTELRIGFSFDVYPGERYLDISIDDDLTDPVYAQLMFVIPTAGGTRYEDSYFCGQAEDVEIPLGTSNFNLYGYPEFGGCRGSLELGYPGTTGTVRATFKLEAGPIANFAPEASFTHACTGSTCTFTDTSTDRDGTVTTWSWDFGDGTTSTAQNPTKSYSSGGAYLVTLLVIDDDGETSGTWKRFVLYSRSESQRYVGGAGGLIASRFRPQGGETRAMIRIEDDVLNPVGGYYFFLRANNSILAAGGFCGSTPDPVSVPNGAVTLDVRVNFVLLGPLYCPLGQVSGPGTTGKITVDWA
ncbi:MAG: S8 family serine peptidase [Acidobacteria bacterium]|nr:S8 family serine peptidase [Acidobacteriota bacterium]